MYPSLLFCWARLKEVLKQFIFIGIWAILLHISKIFLFLKKKIICLKCQQSPRKQILHVFDHYLSLDFRWKAKKVFHFHFQHSISIKVRGKDMSNLRLQILYMYNVYYCYKSRSQGCRHVGKIASIPVNSTTLSILQLMYFSVKWLSEDSNDTSFRGKPGSARGNEPNNGAFMIKWEFVFNSIDNSLFYYINSVQ